MNPAWHVPAAALDAYAAGDPDPALGASVEAHLLACADCRGRLAAAAGPALGEVRERAWSGVVAGIGTPAPSPPLRLLRRAGLAESDVVLLRAARTLDGPWVLSVIAVVAFAAFAALGDAAGGVLLYLLVAPLVPVVGVVVAFASTDPFDELAGVTPHSAARLALVRTAAVCATGVPVVVALGLAVPAIGWIAVAWLVPALALTLLCLVGMTWTSAAVAGSAVSALWVAVVAVARLSDEAAAAVDPALLLVQTAVAVCAAVCLAVRLTHAHPPGGPR